MVTEKEWGVLRSLSNSIMIGGEDKYILAAVADYADFRSRGFFKRWLLVAARLLFVNLPKNLDEIDGSQGVVLVSSQNRSDYVAKLGLLRSKLECAGAENVLVLVGSVKYFSLVFYGVFDACKGLAKRYEIINDMGVLGCLLLLVFSRNSLEVGVRLNRVSRGVGVGCSSVGTKVVFLNSANAIEASWCASVSSAKRIEVYTLQHGFYPSFTNRMPFDFINYFNVGSDNLLVWDRRTKLIFEQYSPHLNVYIAGGLLLGDSCNVKFSKDKVRNVFLKLARDFHVAQNINLLKLAGQVFGNDFYVDFHPSSDTSIYSAYFPSQYACPEKVEIDPHCDLILCTSSSVYFDYIRMGFLALLYVDEDSEFEGVCEIHSAEDLILILQDVSKIATYVRDRRENYLLEYAGLGIDNYSEILLSQ